MKFAISPKNIPYADYLLPFELLFRDTDLCEVPNYGKKIIHSRLRDCVFTSYNNLSKENYLTLKHLIINRDLVIQKADKGNTLFILNKNDYIS